MSFEIARMAINSVNSALDVISNNIANAHSYGYKSKRANFSAMYAGNMPNGAEVSSVTESITNTGGVRNTGGSMDAMITDRGFFAVRDDSGQIQFTRVGMFNVDKDGYVIDASNRRVQGYAAFRDASGQLIPGAALGPLGDLRIETGQIGAVASTKLGYNGNMSQDWTVPATTPFSMADATSFNSSVTSSAYDSQGAKHTLTQYFVKTGTNAISVYISVDGAAPAAAPTTTLAFNGQGLLASVDGTAGNTKHTLTFTPPGANPVNLAIDYAGTTQYAGDTSTLLNQPDGNAAGMLNGTSIAEDGSILASYTNGQTQVVGTVAVATFANPSGLKPGANTSWTATQGSGTPLFSTPGSATASALAVGVLEDSNVDLTGELVDLMSAQRNYQANTKVISAESEMMQSLMQAI